MLTKQLFKTLSIAVACLTLGFNALALDSSSFATSSKLATGKWVKIQVPTSGVYELTDAELTAMGFSNPANVRVYGSGGYMLSEVLNGTQPDDLRQVSTKRFGDKLVFYAKGVARFTLTDPNSNTPRFTRTLNAYSTAGYYFLCESDDPELNVVAATQGSEAATQRASSLDYFWHETDRTSLGQTGKSFLGEDLLVSNKFEYNLPGLCPDSLLVVSPSVAAMWTSMPTEGYVQAFLNDGTENRDSIPFTISQSTIRYVTQSNITYYNQATPYAAVVPKNKQEQGDITIDMRLSYGRPTKLYLDYFILTYYRRNALTDDDAQVRLGFNKLLANDQVVLPDADENLVVWNIDNEDIPRSFQLSDIEGGKAFIPGFESRWAQFIAFDPSKQLNKISGYETVENQNIHGQPVPDMVILTSKEFMPQAERIAEMHRLNDALDVLVVDQEQVFNEFSSGTQDAMAVRLMNKMFYDRDKDKFKHFLVFGCGSYDNRGLISNKPNRVITYESDNSSEEVSSYTCDDFFGYMDDNSGYDVASDKLRLGVGRIPAADLAEAKSDVDKLLNYVNNPDYGPWRNNSLSTADQDNGSNENGLHMFQAEGIVNIVGGTNLNTDRVYVPFYPKATAASETGKAENSRSAVTARQRMTNLLKEGQYFLTYVGHAGHIGLTSRSKLWTSTQAQNVTYEHLPIFTTACCDVARYDGDMRGVCEHMFHNPNGGAIALLTSTRSVYANDNDNLNRPFVQKLFDYATSGTMNTLGEIYIASKNSFGNERNVNKMAFMLMGDPAMRVNYPKPLFNIRTLNGVDVSSNTITAKPLDKIVVEAQVSKEGTNELDTDFNGTATVTLYDAQAYYNTYTNRVGNRNVTRAIYYPREMLARIEGDVVNGKFTGTIIVPRDMQAENDSTLILRVYAHKTGTDQMVNGVTNNIIARQLDDLSGLPDDDNAPVITSLFFNDESSFAEGMMVPANSTLYVNAEDDLGISVQETSGSGTMTLTLDGGKTSYPEVKSYARLTNDGKNLSLAFPFQNLQPGIHTATFTVYDIMGNSAQKTVSFVVGDHAEMQLELAEIPAITQATIDMSTDLTSVPQVTLKITDAVGKLVAVKNNVTFPFAWDLKDNNGERVQAGLYKFFGTFNDGINSGGTPIYNLIVIDPVKRN